MSENSTKNECNHTPYDQLSYFIRVPFMVPVLAFGIGSNILNIIIFRHPTMRTSMVNWYLIALAASDLCVLLGSFLMLSFPVISEDFQTLTMNIAGAYVQRWTYAFGLMAQTCSVGLLLMVSSHRFLGVRFPFVAQRLCTPERVKVAIISVFIFATVFNLLRWFELDVALCHSQLFNDTGLKVVVTDLRKDHIYYVAYVVCTYTIVMFVIPFVLLIVMNSIIVKTVHRSYRLRQELTQGNSTKITDGVNGRQQIETSARENKTTIMLIVVVFVFLLCNSLAFINNILEVILAQLDDSPGSIILREAYLIACEISNFLVVINSSSNIFIYWMFSGKFRLLLQYYLCCATLRRRDSSRNAGLTDTTALLIRNGTVSSPRKDTSRIVSSRKVTKECNLPSVTAV